MKRTPVKHLAVSSVEVTPRTLDFTEGHGETWEYTEAARCEECGEVLLVPNGEEQHRYIDNDSSCEGYLHADGPAMNYFYKLPEHRLAEDESAKRLVDLPLCLVYLINDDVHGLALTGGGMDLSWEICEAYMLLGYLPPLHFAGHLPRMAGLKLNTRTKWILSGARRSAQIAGYRADLALLDIRNLRKQLREERCHVNG